MASMLTLGRTSKSHPHRGGSRKPVMTTWQHEQDELHVMRYSAAGGLWRHSRWLSSWTTSFPGSSLFLPRESALVSAGLVAPKIWVLTRMCYRGGVAECKIVTSVRMVESTGGDVSFSRNICGDKNSFYGQVFLHYVRTFDIEAVHVIFDSEKHVYKSLNFKTLSLS